MFQLAKKFIGKKCIIYVVQTFSSELLGTIKEVTEGAILVEDKYGVQVVNLDFVIRIKECPIKKNRDKKIIPAD